MATTTTRSITATLQFAEFRSGGIKANLEEHPMTWKPVSETAMTNCADITKALNVSLQGAAGNNIRQVFSITTNLESVDDGESFHYVQKPLYKISKLVGKIERERELT